MSSNKADKKLERKLRKHQHVVTKETGVICTSSPTPCLAICNAGLVNGFSEESIINNFIEYGRISNIVLLPEKSCCFFSYDSIDSAVRAFEKSNGVLNIAQDNKPIYLSYVKHMPEPSSQKIYNELPPGALLLKDFVTIDEERYLLKLFSNVEDEDSSQNMKNRQVKHYGYEFRYDINNVDKDKPLSEDIPKEFNFLSQRLLERLDSKIVFRPDQLTINCYKPGQGIPSHIDTHSAFESPIISLSLGSSIVMDFKNDNKHLSVLLPQRSLLAMSDESRYSWAHGITPRKYDTICTENGFNTLQRGTRLSFTFRKIRIGDCLCEYKNKCDSFKSKGDQNLNNSMAEKLEQLYVHEVYEEISDHFSETRHKPWPNVVEFIDSFGIGSILVDVGCGNGKYLRSDGNIFMIGCDMSKNLIEVCRSRGLESYVCNSLNLPIKDNFADGAISIAVIHHMANEERRLRAIEEIIRILKVGGTALIYVWAKNQAKDEQKSAYIKQSRKNRKSANITSENSDLVTVLNDVKLHVHTNRTQFKHDNILVPWKLKLEKNEQSNPGKTFLRYYHVFSEGELEMLLRNFSNIDILRIYYDQGNWCVLFQKVS